MKRMLIMGICIIFTCIFFAQTGNCGSERMKVPKVMYLEPSDDTEVDLTGKTQVEFKWKQQPLPPGGRESYRFRLYKGFSYEVLDAQELSQDTFSAIVPAEKFENGQLYSWHVEQRDRGSRLWSLFHTWSFKVIKK